MNVLMFSQPATSPFANTFVPFSPPFAPQELLPPPASPFLATAAAAAALPVSGQNLVLLGDEDAAEIYILDGATKTFLPLNPLAAAVAAVPIVVENSDDEDADDDADAVARYGAASPSLWHFPEEDGAAASPPHWRYREPTASQAAEIATHISQQDLFGDSSDDEDEDEDEDDEELVAVAEDIEYLMEAAVSQ
jgi:hypothetical protein